MVWAKMGAIFMFLAVAAGAFGAHALREKLSPHYLEVYKTAVLYQMVHALGLFAVAWLSTNAKNNHLNFAGYCMVIGIVLFSGSLYALTLTSIKWLGAITPLGGISFLIGWAIVFLNI